MKSSLPVSWGRIPLGEHEIFAPAWAADVAPILKQNSENLAHGQGRSYGDSCANAGGALLETRFLNRIHSFDQVQGIVRAEAGCTLEQLLTLAVPHGWFLPVSPGTKYVSLGGAVANDIHGKNHHQAGSLGNHVSRLWLTRSDGENFCCSADENSQLFFATIGGLGLTGFISEVELQLKKISGPWLSVDTIAFSNLDGFFEASASAKDFEYTVAWLDCLTTGSSFGRGILFRGTPHREAAPYNLSIPRQPKISVPITFPSFALNRLSMKLFNEAYYFTQSKKGLGKKTHYDPFFYPLDGITGWNKIYGQEGFFQFQCVVPATDNHHALRQILNKIVASQQGSFLAVLKEFGSVASRGLLSFPQPGDTLCLDFPNRGQLTRELFSQLEQLVLSFGGRLYPAKDALMSAQAFKQFYPRWSELAELKDPKFQSSFWKRVTHE